MSQVLRSLTLSLLAFGAATPAWAVDSYRYLHVTIDTPWHIFIFLLFIVLSPFILMAILYWHFAGRKPEEEQPGSTDVEARKEDR